MAEIEHTMTPREFSDWIAFIAEHPLPIDVIDMHAAIQTATLINVNRGRDQPAAKWLDYTMLRERKAPPLKIVEGELTIAQRMKRAAGQ